MPTISRLIVSGVDYRLVKPQQLHAVACMLLDDEGTHRDARKEWAIGPIRGDDAGRVVVMTLRALTDVVSYRLRHRAAQGTRLVFGEQEGTIVDGPELLTEATWDELSEPVSPPPPAWRIEFMSPTALSSHRRLTPLITPSSLLGSLSRRWESLWGRGGDGVNPWLPRLGEHELDHIWVTDVAGRTVTTAVPHTTGRAVADKVLPGFVGDMVLQCDDPMVAQAVDCYLRFARFAGVGALTTHGFGTVDVHAARLKDT